MMNEKQILQVLAQLGISNFAATLTAGVTVLLAANPVATDAELLSEDEGAIKHAIRTKIGWLVDLIWPAVQPYVDQAIRTAIATVRGEGAGENI